MAFLKSKQSTKDKSAVLNQNISVKQKLKDKIRLHLQWIRKGFKEQ